MAAPNIAGTTTITGKTAVLAVTTTQAAIVSNTAASDKVFKVNSLIISNIDGLVAADITVVVKRSATDYALASTIAIPNDTSLVVINKDSTVYLEEGDAIHLTASATGDLVGVCSYEEIS